MDEVSIEGQPSSLELREQLAGETVILAFSRGKDSIAAWLALRDAGVDVIPYHMYLVPDLEFVDKSLAYFAEFFGVEDRLLPSGRTRSGILNLPHPSLYRWLENFTYQAPERCRVIEGVGIKAPQYTDINPIVREYFGLPPDTWVVDGVRAADSPPRRMALKAHGPINHKARTQKIVWDWKIAHVREAIARSGVKLPPDYDWFKRSFDGMDRRFMEPLAREAYDDYRRILEWFPMFDLDIARAAL